MSDKKKLEQPQLGTCGVSPEPHTVRNCGDVLNWRPILAAQSQVSEPSEAMLQANETIKRLDAELVKPLPTYPQNVPVCSKCRQPSPNGDPCEKCATAPREGLEGAQPTPVPQGEGLREMLETLMAHVRNYRTISAEVLIVKIRDSIAARDAALEARVRLEETRMTLSHVGTDRLKKAASDGLAAGHYHCFTVGNRFGHQEVVTATYIEICDELEHRERQTAADILEEIQTETLRAIIDKVRTLHLESITFNHESGPVTLTRENLILEIDRRNIASKSSGIFGKHQI